MICKLNTIHKFKGNVIWFFGGNICNGFKQFFIKLKFEPLNGLFLNRSIKAFNVNK